MKGGVGKTTLATNVCHYLATNENKRVLLVDIDPQFNATQCFMSGDDYIDYCSKKRDTICNIFGSSAFLVGKTTLSQQVLSHRAFLKEAS